LAAAGLPAPDSLIAPTRGWEHADGAAAMRHLLDAGELPDAVFAYNDLIAIGAMRVLSERGLRVPEDVAVVGFDDVTEGRYGAVTLTTIAPDKHTIARLAVQSVVERLGVAAEPRGTTDTRGTADIRGTAEAPDSAEASGNTVGAGRRELRADFRLVERESTIGRQ
jgi:DNA-binding LacI/PurR family transcriptional regulator